ncbi:intradiol ring-cleavage dioxygenase [Verrucomicrobiales bacterium]|nr:intradiol ring-cleavage dioxygenase [Verrucomicrobiales bacterium]MDC0322453.1 intradiol ring-cleavage dioxygenase [Verrucomicrobiales bacterium]
MKNQFCPDCHRRQFLRRALLGSAGLFTAPGLFAEQLALTPFQTEGPFYPDKLPLDTDNDLVLLNDSLTPSVGEITHLTGQIFNQDGFPARGVVIELWQADAQGCYIHTKGAARGQERDANFQGYGRFLTGSDGRYYFRAIRPVPYGPRTSHYHVAVNTGDKRMLTTQVYDSSQELNKTDRILQSAGDAKTRALLITDFKPLKGSKVGELTANFDIFIGNTPEDPKTDRGRKGPGTGFRPDGKGKGKGKGKG